MSLNYNNLMAKHISRYKVFLDSNAVRDNDWVKTDLFIRMEALRNEGLADVKFLLPEIIREEWLHHYRRVARTSQSNANRHNLKLKTMGLSPAEPEDFKDEHFDKAALKILSRNRI